MRNLVKLVSTALACSAFAIVATASDARPRARQVRDTQVLVVHPRSFADSGVVVPVGSRNAYVQEMTQFNLQPYQKYSPGVLWMPEPSLFR
jgi:hypothetical protein